MKKYKILSVVGARPNFMKIAPLHKEFQRNKNNFRHFICHTGQHYDNRMSKIFFTDLELPKPDFYLGVGSGSHSEQTGKVMIEFEKVLLKVNPDLVVVVGDVNSTIACSLVAAKLGIKIAHIEAGLRSGDRTMPEEINRVLTDSISDYLFVTEKSGLDNLMREGISRKKIYFVGNTMIDSLIFYKKKNIMTSILENMNVEKKDYILVTLHRPANVDDKKNLTKILKLLRNISKFKKIIFPIHPRTREKINRYKLGSLINKNILLSEPIGYLDFLELTTNAKLIITDSGGIQEESTYLGVQCITLRQNTERPVTVESGTNHLLKVSFDDFLNENYMRRVEDLAVGVLEGKLIKKGVIPNKWDGKTANRIVSILRKNEL